MENDQCPLCSRIGIKHVFQLFNTVLPGTLKTKHPITTRAVSIIKETYKKYPTKFCGKSKIRIIGGLLYYLCHNYYQYYRISYRKIGICAFDLWHSSKNSNNLINTIMAGYRDWTEILG